MQLKPNNQSVIKKYINFFLSNTYSIFALYILSLSIVTIIYCKIYSQLHPEQIGENGEYLINKIGFFFSEIINDLMNGDKPKRTFGGVEFYIAKMPLFQNLLFFLHSKVTENFIFIHLIKNLSLGTIIFLFIKFYDKKLNNLFLFLMLLAIFYVPHNIITILSTNFEEGILIYLLVILFLTLTQNFRYRNSIVALTLSLIFFLKASMFYLSFGLALIFLLVEKGKGKFLPIILILISIIFWGLNSYYKTGKFAFGSSNTSVSGITIGITFHDKFTQFYPIHTPDIFFDDVSRELQNQNFESEWEVNDHLLKRSLNYIKNNPLDVVKGLSQKLYVLFLSPYKDTRTPLQYLAENKKNPIRYSNIPNKIFFIITIFLLLKSLLNFKKLDSFLKTKNIYFLSIIVLYLFPYMAVYIFPRHCVPIYVLSHIYLVLYLTYSNKFPNLKNLFQRF
tara:strand:- start:308 stop:1654 length:1347 start_codon:yes stop_codon:yes gene_type:complete